MPTRRHPIFRTAWWTTNVLLAAAFVSLMYSSGLEYSVRHYLRGFSDALVPASYAPEQKVEAILEWMRNGPPRTVAFNPDQLLNRDPQTTLNYRQLLAVCGTATNAFLNLSRSSGLNARRLLLLTPERRTKHVVAEVLIGGQWIVVDPAYRVILRDARGHFLTRSDLKNPAVFAEAISVVPNYPREYTFDHVAHVRLARLPLEGRHVRWLLDFIYTSWEESVNWSLILERESFFYLLLSAAAAFFILVVRVLLAWYADRQLRIPRFHLRKRAIQAGTAFLSTPEIKQ